MLTPITTPAKRKQFVAYDFEWQPATLAIRLAGTWDGERYRYYRTIGEFLRGELTERNKGKILFAHAGGNFDVQFILEEVVKDPSYDVVATFSGSSAVIVKVRRGKRGVWTFCDSFFLLRSPLRDIGEWLGFEKLDSGAIFDENWDRLKTYNERDCRVLYMAIDALQDEILELGGELKATLASTAMTLFRRRYLRQAIRTSSQTNEEQLDSYYASRVEVFQQECLEAHYFDINSSFPFSMTFPQPGEVINYSQRMPDKEDALFAVDATVRVNECHIPPLPYRDRHYRVLFPTGEWRSKFDVTDIRLLEESGHRIVKIHAVTHFSPFSDLSDYIATLYELKRTSTGFRRELFKLLLNALYGKFAERPEKEKILINPASTRCPHRDANPDCQCMRMIVPGIWQKAEIANIPHAHVPVSAHITALSRLWLYRYISACRDVYYCDTDSVICGPFDSFETSDRLGDLKLEYVIKRGQFLAPKLYRTLRGMSEKESSNPESLKRSGWEDVSNGLVSKVKSKGFRKMTYSQFRDLSEGREYSFERMLSIKESMRLSARGGEPFRVKQSTLSKRALLKSPKRALLPNGGTRPWTIDEILKRGDGRETSSD